MVGVFCVDAFKETVPSPIPLKKQVHQIAIID